MIKINNFSIQEVPKEELPIVGNQKSPSRSNHNNTNDRKSGHNSKSGHHSNSKNTNRSQSRNNSTVQYQGKSSGSSTKKLVQPSREESQVEGEQALVEEISEHSATNKSSNSRKKDRAKYKEFLSQELIDFGLANNTLVKGILRINPYNRKEAYVVVENAKNDIFIDGELLRNRALDRDEVIVQVYDKSQWRRKKISIPMESLSNEDASYEESMIIDDEIKPAADGDTSSATTASAASAPIVMQPTGEVVAIAQRLHLKGVTGYIRSCRDNFTFEASDKHIIFIPLDKRFPKMIGSVTDVPFQELISDPQKYSKDLFVARIVKWNSNSQYPIAHIKQHLGTAGNIETETAAALVENGIGNIKYYNKEVADFTNELFKNWSVNDNQVECKKRRDLRRPDIRIFSIDPEHAKDLDDAVSIQKLDNGLFQVGIHIADVSHFVSPNTILDKEAERRATSVYLVNKVIPMLPEILSENLCSLNPGQDRFAFSVFATVDEQGALVESVPVWFGKTIIQSCAKLSYSVAQAAIDASRNACTSAAPKNVEVFGGHQVQEVMQDVVQLFQIMSKRRHDRLSTGALQIKEEKLCFTLDNQGQPISAQKYELKESNNMVEELMLLANYLVAKKLVETVPSIALLRSHGEPLRRRITELANFCNSVQTLQLQVSALEEYSSSSACELNKLLQQVEKQDAKLAQFLHHMARKAMQPAKYVCAASETQEVKLKHYALNLPFYTHFTSPIRRYADLTVHRVLSQVLAQEEQGVNVSQEDLNRIITQCNRKRMDAQRVQETVSRVYLTALISKQQETRVKTYDAIVMGLSNRAVSLFVPSLGIENRIYLDGKELKEATEYRKFMKNEKKTLICWGTCLQTGEKYVQSIEVAKTIQVQVTVKTGEYGKDFVTTLPRPPQVMKTSLYLQEKQQIRDACNNDDVEAIEAEEAAASSSPTLSTSFIVAEPVVDGMIEAF